MTLREAAEYCFWVHRFACWSCGHKDVARSQTRNGSNFSHKYGHLVVVHHITQGTGEYFRSLLTSQIVKLNSKREAAHNPSFEASSPAGSAEDNA